MPKTTRDWVRRIQRSEDARAGAQAAKETADRTRVQRTGGDH
ncbi:hypothetical protein ABT173_33865 [Streptomyces sp. NPDC001795]